MLAGAGWCGNNAGALLYGQTWTETGALLGAFVLDAWLLVHVGPDQMQQQHCWPVEGAVQTAGVAGQLGGCQLVASWWLPVGGQLVTASWWPPVGSDGWLWQGCVVVELDC